MKAKKPFNTHIRSRGTDHWAARLTEDDVRQIRADYPARTMCDLGKQHHISTVAIFKIIHRKSWRHVV